MATLAALSAALAGRGMAALEQVDRKPIYAAERETVLVPPDLIRADGSLDVYDDVLKLFKPTYQKNKPAIECAGWIGYIPLNDQFALEVKPRVPIGNLERLVGMAAGYAPKVLNKYTRRFAHVNEVPTSLTDVLADQLLAAFEHIWSNGLLKTYTEKSKVGQSPVGRIAPFASAYFSAKTGKPTAVSTSYSRTTDFAPNRLLKLALEKLLVRYSSPQSDGQRFRLARIRSCLLRLDHIGSPVLSDLTPLALASLVKALPAHQEHYADALLVANIIIFDAGLAIRGLGQSVVLPSILIDMAVVFEIYMRKLLATEFVNDLRVNVKDGNKGGIDGAKTELFSPVRNLIKNPAVTPDIVIEVDQKPLIIIDAKYKSSPSVPDRNDINQVILYGAKYEAEHVMLLHADRPKDRESAELCGKIGTYSIYNGMIDLDSPDIEGEEKLFLQSIRSIIFN